MKRLRRSFDFMFLDGFRAASGLMWATLVLTIINGLAQATFPLGFKVFVDAALEDNRVGTIVGVVLSGSLIAVFWFAAMLDANIGFGLTDRMELFVSARIAERVNSVAEIEHFERPDYLQELDLLDQNRYLLRAAPRQTLTALSSIIRGGAMVGLLATVHPAMGLIPIFGIAPGWAQSRSVKIRQRAEEHVAEHRRLADEFFALTATAAPGKELRVYDLNDELIARHHQLGTTVTRTLSRAAILGALTSAAGWLLFVAGFMGALVLVIQRAVNGQATAGDIVLAVVLSQQVRQLLSVIANDVAVMLTTARTAGRAIWLEDYADTLAPDGDNAEPPDTLTTGIAFHNVSFRYPGTDTDILTGLDLTLPPGASVAIVGENGAGKTTLIKLLTRMYPPTSGTITIDGINLSQVPVDAWRRRVTSTFQDHVAFELLASEAVGVGELASVNDLDAIDAALGRANSRDVISTLDNGLATQLGRSFPDGRDLSGGQWQKLALGRGMMRQTPLLLVLDEPTASLDAETEHALFERYMAEARRTRELTGAITVLVTHRFSTVRTADLIVVIEDGRATEIGSHDELMARDGTYAELFQLQARSYS